MRKERLIITIYEIGGLFFLFGEGESGVERGGGGKPEENFIFFRRHRRSLYLID